jgi:hypothetical protein
VSELTNLRINAVLIEHLRGGGVVPLAVVTEAALVIDGVGQRLDLTGEAGRVLAESAGVVASHIDCTGGGPQSRVIVIE